MVFLTLKQSLMIVLGFSILGYLLLSRDVGDKLTFRSIESNWANEPLISTSGCQIRNVNAFDKSILPLLKKEKRFRCQDSKNVSFGLVYLRNSTLYVNVTIRDHVLDYYKADIKDFYCCVSYFKRYSDEVNDGGSRSLGDCTSFTDQLSIVDEFMSINCYLSNIINGSGLIYKNFDFAVLRKSHVEARCRAYEEMVRAQGRTCPERLSVLIIGVDSVSRLQSLRHLTHTRQALHDMGAIEFVGYHRVADNTYPNIGAAMLGGRSKSELDRLCVDDMKMLDNCTFLADYFGATGHRTAYVENMNNYGVFTFSRKGFRRQPADYYGRTFFNGLNSVHAQPDCYRGGASVADDEAVVQWAVEFQTEFARDAHFGWFWTNMFSHNYMNTLMHVDKFMPNYLKRLAADGGALLNNTLLVFMSDHGLRFGDLLETKVGRFEINLPMMFLIFPTWFRRRYPSTVEKLEENARARLTTHFDLHATLREIAGCRGPFAPPDQLSRDSRGISLFMPIPESRTCRDAGIPLKYCSCSEREVALLPNDARVRTLGLVGVGKLNEMSEKLRSRCAKLGLFSVDEVMGRPTNVGNSVSSEKNNRFTVILTTVPGHGIFQLSVDYQARNKSYRADEEVIRLNKYGNDSVCIQDTGESKMFPICFCNHESF